MEGEDLDPSTECETPSADLTADQKRKLWMKKSKTVSTLVSLLLFWLGRHRLIIGRFFYYSRITSFYPSFSLGQFVFLHHHESIERRICLRKVQNTTKSSARLVNCPGVQIEGQQQFRFFGTKLPSPLLPLFELFLRQWTTQRVGLKLEKKYQQIVRKPL